MFKILIIIVIITFVVFITYSNLQPQQMLVLPHFAKHFIQPEINTDNFTYLPKNIKEKIMEQKLNQAFSPSSTRKKVKFDNIVEMRTFDTKTGETLNQSTKIPLRG